MELFSLRKIRRLCPQHCGPGPPAPAHGSMDFIKCWSLSTRSMAQIKPIESVSLLRCLDPIRRWVTIGSWQPIWRWVTIGSSQPLQESPGADLMNEAARRGRARWPTGVWVFSIYGGWFSIRFALMRSQWWGEHVYANIKWRRAATKPDNSEAAWSVLVDGGGGLQWSFGSTDVRQGFLELPSSFSIDQLLRSVAKNSNLMAT
jgi:hypothetical protein